MAKNKQYLDDYDYPLIDLLKQIAYVAIIAYLVMYIAQLTFIIDDLTEFIMTNIIPIINRILVSNGYTELCVNPLYITLIASAITITILVSSILIVIAVKYYDEK